MACFLGIDVSTTATKALLMEERGVVLAVASAPHTLQTPQPLWSEQDPHEWWQATTMGIRQALDKAGVRGDRVRSVGLTGQMHGLVLLDEAGHLLRPAILWNDQRTHAQCEEIHRRVGRERFIQISGNVALTGFTAPKILCVKENEPEVFGRARHILLPKDYVRYRLTGTFALDKADGSGTVPFDLRRRDWSPELLSALEIPETWIAPTYEGPEFTGEIHQEAARASGLRAGVSVVAGGGDQSAQAVGVGAVEPGVVALTMGTSGVVFASTASPPIEPEGRLHAFRHAVPGLWHFMGVMLCAAGSLQWFRDTLASGKEFDEILREAEAVPPGSEGLQFLPYLTGERTPYPDPLARGAWIGLTTRHGFGHLARALARGGRFRPQGQLHADTRGRSGISSTGACIRGRCPQLPVAANPCFRAGGGTGDRQHHRRRSIWGCLAGGGWSGRLARCSLCLQRSAPGYGKYPAKRSSDRGLPALVCRIPSTVSRPAQHLRRDVGESACASAAVRPMRPPASGPRPRPAIIGRTVGRPVWGTWRLALASS